MNTNQKLLDVLAPTGLEFSSREMVFGNKLARVISIIDYPDSVTKKGWLARIANIEDVTTKISFVKANAMDIVEDIAQGIENTRSNLVAIENDAVQEKRLERKIKDMEKLLKKIDEQNEKVFFLNVTLMITATSRENLERKTRRVKSIISASSMRGRNLSMLQKEGLETILDINNIPEQVQQMANRNMPISTIAASYPFVKTGLKDEKGMLLGRDSANSIVLVDDWKRGGDRGNSNWVVLGQPGTGKSTLVKKILTNNYARGTQVIIIDPEREYKDICENFGGQWVEIGNPQYSINPLQIRMRNDDGDTKLAFTEHMQYLRIFFKMYFRGFDDVEIAMLERYTREVYNSENITENTDFTKFDNIDYPTFSDLYNLIVQKLKNTEGTEKEKLKKLEIMVNQVANGTDSKLWNNHTNVDLDSDFIVIDTFKLHNFEKNIKATNYLDILTFVWEKLSQDRNKRSMLAIDEAYLMIDEDVPEALKMLKEFSKRVRKYESALVVISHSVVDFISPKIRKEGEALLTNPTYKFFLGTDGKDLKGLKELYELTEKEESLISKKIRGRGLFVAGSKRLETKVKVSQEELSIFGPGGGR